MRRADCRGLLERRHYSAARIRRWGDTGELPYRGPLHPALERALGSWQLEEGSLSEDDDIGVRAMESRSRTIHRNALP